MRKGDGCLLVLRAIRDYDAEHAHGCTARDISEIIDCNQGDVLRHMQRLDRLGMIKCVGTDPAHEGPGTKPRLYEITDEWRKTP